ncbi:4-amino-4-deoxychorismate lyase [Verrucomicrobia bacterium LW23]|nr:4-amino-4-deoxychorismate lyase [Verrucomicrobia bacterium LW23]
MRNTPVTSLHKVPSSPSAARGGSGARRPGKAVSSGVISATSTERAVAAAAETASAMPGSYIPGLFSATSFRPWLGVFETIRVVHGVPLFLNEHWKSIRHSADTLGLEVMRDFRQVAPHLPQLTGRWRWIVTPGESVHFFVEDNTRVPAAFTLGLADQQVCSKNWDSRHKTLSYLTHYQARTHVRADEAVLTNEDGNLATCSMGNLFWVHNGELCTPPGEAGCRRGVVRDFVMRRARVKEVLMKPAVLDEATEIFVTNSWCGVRPVWRWRSKTLPLGEKCRAVRQAYRDELHHQLQSVMHLMQNDNEFDPDAEIR